MNTKNTLQPDTTLKNKLKVMTIVGTRPEIIRLSRVISKLDQFCDHTLIHTGQNYDYELNQIFFDELGIRKPDMFLKCADLNLAKTIANIITKTDEILTKFKPEALLLLGDTNSTMAAISAKRKKIPIFHMEAGNRSFDLRVPEEINRKIVDHISDINMPYSDIARSYLIREGIQPELIIKTGSPLTEVLSFYLPKINKSNILKKLKLKKKNYFVVSMHREENVDSESNMKKFVASINTIADQYKCPIILSTHPRTRNRIKKSKYKFHDLVQSFKPLGFLDYVYLQLNSKTVLSDSGSITEESSILNFPAVNIRDVHERPEGMEEGAVIFTGMSTNEILRAINIALSQSSNGKRNINLVNDYSSNNVSEKVLRIIHSYTHYVNRVVWKKV